MVEHRIHIGDVITVAAFLVAIGIGYLLLLPGWLMVMLALGLLWAVISLLGNSNYLRRFGGNGGHDDT